MTKYSAERRAPHPGPGADVERLRVSVVIPTFDRVALLRRALESALRAVSPADEIIVVDDGSTDGTAEVLASYGDAIRCLRQPHGGAGRARNRGIAEAKHPLVAFLDSDDEWMRDHLELGRRLLQARPDLLFCFSDFLSRRFDGVVRRFRLSSWHQDPRSWDEILGDVFAFSSVAALPAGREDFQVYAGDLYPSLLRAPYVPTITALVRRGPAGNALHFPEDLPVYEDWECFARLAREGRTAYLACETAVNWGHRGARLTGADPVVLGTARITMRDRVWGADPVFLGAQGREYRRILHGERLALSKWLFRQGHTRAAGRQAALAGRRGLAYRALGVVPGPLARASLAALDRLIARARSQRGTTGGLERARSLQGPHAGT